MTAYVYLIEVPVASGSVCTKIGVATDPKRRLQELQCGCLSTLTLRHLFECADLDQANELEHRLHAKFREHRIRGEWFELTSAEIVATVKSDTPLQRSVEPETLLVVERPKPVARKRPKVDWAGRIAACKAAFLREEESSRQVGEPVDSRACTHDRILLIYQDQGAKADD